jgi:hypothetical protein
MERTGENVNTARKKLKDMKEEAAALQLSRRHGDDHLSHVDWDYELVDALVNAVDPNLLPPAEIKARAPLLGPARAPWLDIDGLIKILISGTERLKRDEEEVFSGMAMGGLAWKEDQDVEMEME